MSKKLVDWLRYASITQGGGAPSGGFFTGTRSRQVINPHSYAMLSTLEAYVNSGEFIDISLCFLLSLFWCFLLAGTDSRAGRDGLRGFLHCAVCGTELHWGPVDERLLLLHASPLAHHLPLCFQWQHNSWHWYDLPTNKKRNLLFSCCYRLIALCHSYREPTGNIGLKAPFVSLDSVFPSSPANRLQLSLSLSLSHSFSNGKTCQVRGLSLHARSSKKLQISWPLLTSRGQLPTN